MKFYACNEEMFNCERFVTRNTKAPRQFSPQAEIPGSIELLENSLTYEGVQWKKNYTMKRTLFIIQ